MTTKKATAEQLRQVVTFLLSNAEKIESEDIKRLAEALLPIQLKNDTPEPEPFTPEVVQNFVPSADTVALTDGESMSLWIDTGTKDEVEVTRTIDNADLDDKFRKPGMIQLRFSAKPKKLALDLIKSVKIEGTKRKAFWYVREAKVWVGEAKEFPRLLVRYKPQEFKRDVQSA